MKNKLWMVVLAVAMLVMPCMAWAADAVAPGSGIANPQSIDKNHLEGWIIGVDYIKSNFRLLDPRGFQRRVLTKQGTIGDYRLGDKVRVEVDPDRKIASMIEKID